MRKVAGGGAAAAGRGATIERWRGAGGGARDGELARAGELSGRLDEPARAGELETLGARFGVGPASRALEARRGAAPSRASASAICSAMRAISHSWLGLGLGRVRVRVRAW